MVLVEVRLGKVEARVFTLKLVAMGKKEGAMGPKKHSCSLRQINFFLGIHDGREISIF